MGRLSRKRKLLYLACAVIFVLGFNHVFISSFTNPRIDFPLQFKSNKLPSVGLVLGCFPITDTDRSFYLPRLRKAAALFHAGKVDALLVSGDNGRHGYDEPTAMKNDLIKLGVPAEYITCDYAGFRTLDSVVRAKAVFGQERVIIISQRFHVQRALFLAYHTGLNATGVAAEEPKIGMRSAMLREVAARFKTCVDVMFNVEPKYYGPPESIKRRSS